MYFLLSRRLPSSYPLFALIATHLVISMSAPLVKRSPEESDPRGFSNVPKILEIQLPLKIASKDDLVAWAKYVMGLMASKINITLTTVKDTTPSPVEPARNPSNFKQAQSIKTSGFKNLDPGRPAGTMRTYQKNFDMPRYAENLNDLGNLNNLGSLASFGSIKNLGSNLGNLHNLGSFNGFGAVQNLGNQNFGNQKTPARNKSPEEFRIQNTNRYPEKNRVPVNTTPPPRKESSLPAFSAGALSSKNFLGIRPTTFANLGISDTTVHSPLEITASINLAKPEIKEPLIKEGFGLANSLKPALPFVPTFPDFGPSFTAKNGVIFETTETVSPPSRAYLPVTTDNARFSTDSFATRYFFDGIERNISSNLGVLPIDFRFSTIRPLGFNEEIPLPIKTLELATKNLTNAVKPVINVPFEAVITFTREAKIEPTTSKTENDKVFAVPTRDPPDEFPPYFDTNYTMTNESGQINVVFDDGTEVIEQLNTTRDEEKKKPEKKKKKEGSSSKQKKKEGSSSKQKTKKPSMLGQIIKAFAALRRKPNGNSGNQSLSVDLSPPPLKPLRFPAAQNAAPTERPQSYPQKQQSYPQRPQTYPQQPSASRDGRRNQTSLAQELEDDDEDGDSSEDKSEEDNDNDKEELGSDEGSSESESEEDYDDEDEEEGGSIQAVIQLLQLVGPVLEDLSDPNTDTDIVEVLEAAIPILQDLSDGDEDTPGIDIPGILVPIFLQISGGPDGMGDSAAILTPLLQLIAPLIGPLSGPLIVPLSRQSSNAPGDGGSNSATLIQNLSGPLSEVISGPGKMTMLTNLVSGVVSSLSKGMYGKGGSDITSLVKAIVAGSVAGTSAGSSAPRDTYGPPPATYGGDYSYGGQSYNRRMMSAGADPLALLGSSIKDIINAVLKIVTSLVNALMGILGASSGSSEETPSPSPTYGPPRPNYGAPSPYAAAPLTPPPRVTSQNNTRTTPRRVRF
ncbi:uncharacterized protein LOC143174602 [Nomia melanderi]|uniref:uncharacterized protein LOC143174602 n=1 Tax=Nomia melanderi TaxID=2448451 RepID=UPI003FCEAA7C